LSEDLSIDWSSAPAWAQELWIEIQEEMAAATTLGQRSEAARNLIDLELLMDGKPTTKRTLVTKT